MSNCTSTAWTCDRCGVTDVSTNSPEESVPAFWITVTRTFCDGDPLPGGVRPMDLCEPCGLDLHGFLTPQTGGGA